MSADFIAKPIRRHRVYTPRRAVEITPVEIAFTLSPWIGSALLRHESKPAALHPEIHKALEEWACGSKTYRIRFSRVGAEGLPGATEARAFQKILNTLLATAKSRFKNGSADDALRWRVNSISKWLQIDVVTVVGGLEGT